MNINPRSYGKHLWMLMRRGEREFLYADRIELDDSGTLAFISDMGMDEEETMPLNIVAPGHWESVDLVNNKGMVLNWISDDDLSD